MSAVGSAVSSQLIESADMYSGSGSGSSM